jgi:hypothetical protein
MQLGKMRCEIDSLLNDSTRELWRDNGRKSANYGATIVELVNRWRRGSSRLVTSRAGSGTISRRDNKVADKGYDIANRYSGGAEDRIAPVWRNRLND